MSAIAENSATPVMRSCSIPSLSAPAVPVVLAVETGKSIIIVGANGSGKTRLGAYLEQSLPPDVVQRIKQLKITRYE